jgi:hypothetical protein
MMGFLNRLFSRLAKATEDSSTKNKTEEENPEAPPKDAYAAMDRVSESLSNLDKIFDEHPEYEEELMKKLKDI